MAPCEKGLDAECFASHPDWAKRVFAFRLLHTFFPGEISKRLPPSLGFAPLPPDVVFPPGFDPSTLPPGTYFPPGFVWPPGWLPGDPLPSGLLPPPDFPPDISGSFPLWYLDPSIFMPIPAPSPDIFAEFDYSVVSKGEDGVIGNSDTNFTTVHDASTGDFLVDDSTQYDDATYVQYAGAGCTINRAFMQFFLGSIPATAGIVSCTITLKCFQNEDNETIIQEGTQAATLTTADFDSFTGEYFDKITFFKPDNGTWGEKIFTLNAAGLAYVKSTFGNTASFCIRNYDYDYLNITPTLNFDTPNQGIKFRENAVVADRPTIDIVYEA